MYGENMSIREFQRRFKAGEFENGSVKTQCEAGWWDWFCRDTSLKNKTKRLGNFVCRLKGGKRVDLDNDYVFFKNNCPLIGPLYDSISICDLEKGEVKFFIAFGDKRESDNYVVYDVQNELDEPAVVGRKEVLEYLNQ